MHEYKYLGININEFLNWEDSLRSIVIKAQRALAGLNCKTKCLGGFHFSTYTRLFEALVLPIIHYSANVWGNKCSDRFTKVQTQAMRFCHWNFGPEKNGPRTNIFTENIGPPDHDCRQKWS